MRISSLSRHCVAVVRENGIRKLIEIPARIIANDMDIIEMRVALSEMALENSSRQKDSLMPKSCRQIETPCRCGVRTVEAIELMTVLLIAPRRRRRKASVALQSLFDCVRGNSDRRISSELVNDAISRLVAAKEYDDVSIIWIMNLLDAVCCRTSNLKVRALNERERHCRRRSGIGPCLTRVSSEKPKVPAA